jgi:hypothetical protein
MLDAYSTGRLKLQRIRNLRSPERLPLNAAHEEEEKSYRSHECSHEDSCDVNGGSPPMSRVWARDADSPDETLTDKID